VQQDPVQAREWYRKAATAGNTVAMNNLGVLYLRCSRPDYVEARNWFEKAAANGQVNAVWSIGYLFSRGLGITQDVSQARVWFEKAAALGRLGAQIIRKEPLIRTVELYLPRSRHEIMIAFVRGQLTNKVAIGLDGVKIREKVPFGYKHEFSFPVRDADKDYQITVSFGLKLVTWELKNCTVSCEGDFLCSDQ
jgi:hypothetical protein